MGGALISEKSKVDVSTVITRASKKAEHAATAKQSDTAASILEKSTTKEVVDSTAVEQVAATVVPSIRGAAFKRAKEFNAEAKNGRAKRVGDLVKSELGVISKHVAANIIVCFNASVYDLIMISMCNLSMSWRLI